MSAPFRKGLVAAVLLLAAAPAFAEGAAMPYTFKPSTGNAASLQRGARNFMNYCSGCHSLKYLRYNRLGRDLGIPDDLLKANLMFTSDKLGDTIKAAMPAAESAQWFGRTPPDLSLSARERGADWIYSYLLTFYLDPSKATGVNNLVLPGAAMPHVLGDLQGYNALGGEGGDVLGEHQEEHRPNLVQVQKGQLTPEEYREFVGDLTNFMVYAAEPGRNRRMAVGGFVLAFIVVFGILSYLLKVEYWKDIH